MSIAGSALDLRLKSVLMATDLSPASVKPLHHALAIARYYGAKLYVAHVVSPIPYLMAGPEALQLGCEGAHANLWEVDNASATTRPSVMATFRIVRSSIGGGLSS